MARALAEELPLLDPKFSAMLAKAVLKQASKMPEREVVSALNVCTTMAAKSKLMQGKGLTKDIDPLSEIRDWFKQSTLVETPAEADTRDSDDTIVPDDPLAEVYDGPEEHPESRPVQTDDALPHEGAEALRSQELEHDALGGDRL